MNTDKLIPFLATAFKHRRKILLVGAPGIGKSDIITEAAHLAGLQLEIMHPAVSDPTDFKGMPAVHNNLADFLPFGQLRRLLEAKKPTLAFIDDIGQAPHAVQAALMQLLQAREINGQRISNHIIFAGATNDSSHMAGVAGIIEPVKSRWDSIIHISPTAEAWCHWALNHDMPPELIAFIRLRPNFITDDFKPTRDLINSSSPRTITAVGHWLNIGIEDHEVLAGAAGIGFATEFIGFLKVYNTIPDLNQLYSDPLSTPIPSDPSTRYALAAALTAAAEESNLAATSSYLERMGNEWQTMVMRDVVIKHPHLTETAAYIHWATQNATALA